MGISRTDDDRARDHHFRFRRIHRSGVHSSRRGLPDCWLAKGRSPPDLGNGRSGHIENGLKYGFHRARPEPFYGAAPASYSFPSGHALFSTCFYFVLASAITERIRSRAMRALIRLAAALFVAAIGLSRIYLGFHYPSDILGGYLAAAILLGAIMSIERMNEIAKPKA
jgi:hypothetical protein